MRIAVRLRINDIHTNGTEFPVEVLLSHDFSEGKVATFVRTPWE